MSKAIQTFTDKLSNLLRDDTEYSKDDIMALISGIQEGEKQDKNGDSTGQQMQAMRPEAQFNDLFVRMYQLCQENKWGDPFSYARSREIHMANHLGHTIAKDYSGSDATDAEGNPVEYKSTIGTTIRATYNGISVHPTWEAQLEYLRTEKIGKYAWHFFARYEEGRIQEIWKMSGEKVLTLLIPKLKKQYESEHKRKDPRLGSSLTTKEIKDNATLV